MRELIQESIERKARSVLARHRLDVGARRKYADKFHKRTGLPAGAVSDAYPSWWEYHPHFDPAYCIKHSKYLSGVLWRKLVDGEYQPMPAIQFDVPKPDGTSRQIMAFTIPDAALSNVVHRQVTLRNINLFSSYSYAYRPDKSIFDAILHLIRSLSGPKSYIIQYDFRKYFDSIAHDYLERVLFERETFILSSAERTAIKSFLSHRYSHVRDYSSGDHEVRTKGVPQGSSLSLFLSNAAAHDLDLTLERRNGTFVRFADDVVAITNTYTDALDVAKEFRAHCRAAGLKINYEKSPGIRLFRGGPAREHRDFAIDGDDAAHLQGIDWVDYLGHRISAAGVSLPDSAVRRIKRRIAETIYKHLFLNRRSGTRSFNADRIGPGFVDWDLVTCLNEIRRYIYGGLRESQIEGFLDNNIRPPFVRGLMSFLPLMRSIDQLKDLDGWLVNIMRRAQRERVRIITKFGHTLEPISESQLISGEWYDYPEIFNDTRMPSFVRASRVARKYYKRFGLQSINPPAYYSAFSY